MNKKAGGRNLDEIKDERYSTLMKFLKETNSKWVIVDAKIEDELKDFEGEEKEEMRNALVSNEPDLNIGKGPVLRSFSEAGDGVNNLIKAGYDMLNLITYFTTGEDESRAWTIHKGWSAPMAGTAIHTDFKDKFVKAEIIEWDKLLSSGSYAAAREKGLVRTEGK